MKRFIADFFLRGLIAGGFGPIILAILYLILQHNNIIDTLTVNEVCAGILSVSVLAFISGGMNAVYRIERLPLMAAIMLHGAVLYVCYLITYILNSWLESGIKPILVFSGIFIISYFVIWAIIYCVNKRKTKKLNEMLHKKQKYLK